MRRASKIDLSQPEVVTGLRALGYHVALLKRPVDIAVRHPMWMGGLFMLMEVKTPTKSGKRHLRADQKAQDDFIRDTGTPVVMNLDQALEALRGL